MFKGLTWKWLCDVCIHCKASYNLMVIPWVYCTLGNHFLLENVLILKFCVRSFQSLQKVSTLIQFIRRVS